MRPVSVPWAVLAALLLALGVAIGLLAPRLVPPSAPTSSSRSPSPSPAPSVGVGENDITWRDDGRGLFRVHVFGELGEGGHIQVSLNGIWPATAPFLSEQCQSTRGRGRVELVNPAAAEARQPALPFATFTPREEPPLFESPALVRGTSLDGWLTWLVTPPAFRECGWEAITVTAGLYMPGGARSLVLQRWDFPKPLYWVGA